MLHGGTVENARDRASTVVKSRTEYIVLLEGLQAEENALTQEYTGLYDKHVEGLFYHIVRIAINQQLLVCG